ncbi:MAG: tRNA (N6-isopentenyl adenosine(37)-C2)-methylthiotransferase MiaB [Thermodesulfovibrionales bacterium]|nr:tRNA (N6-isopentenyl adenosine(37)-C2)-methylthiotransferase MiaB [Thermodesulfovibrionales bacterium]
MKKYCMITFGCQMNVHDSEKMAGLLKSEGYSETEDPKDADIVIFNTCSIRQKAEQKFFSQLGRTKAIKKRKPGLKIAVAGCIAQQEGSSILQRTPYVDYVIGPQNICAIKDIVRSDSAVIATDDNPNVADIELPADRKDTVRAWINIMYGCNNFCSYCIVPYTRGREKSRPAISILDEIKELADKGFKEITLLGQNVNSYKSDMNFPALLGEINRIGGIERIRFVTSHPKDLSNELIYAIRDLEKVCEHVHLPLQSGSTRILALMNRKYAYADYVKTVGKLCKEIPGIAITSDIIAGFPYETDEDHKTTINAIKEIGFDGIFAFKFSPRPGTKASEMTDQLDEGIKTERLYEILEVQNKITEDKNRMLEGRVQEVLIEGISENDSKKFSGRTRTNKIVNIPSTKSLRAGDIVKVKVTRALRHSLEGKPV